MVEGINRHAVVFMLGMALTLHLHFKQFQMIEKHRINGKEVWVEVEQQPANRSNPNSIPTEYFTARYYLEEPPGGESALIKDENGEPRLFESPVAALTYASKKLMTLV
jgi:hypothetical protein